MPRQMPIPGPGTQLPRLSFLAKYPVHLRIRRVEVEHGRSEEESLALAPQYAALAPCAARSKLRRMFELRRTEAAAPRLSIVRLLRRTRSNTAGSAEYVIFCRPRGVRGP